MSKRTLAVRVAMVLVLPITWASVAFVAPASASNPCNADGKFSKSQDKAWVRVVNSGCPNIGIRMRYQPPSTGVFYTTRHRAAPVGMVAYETSHEPEAMWWDACSSTTSTNCTTWGSDLQFTSWYTF